MGPVCTRMLGAVVLLPDWTAVGGAVSDSLPVRYVVPGLAYITCTVGILQGAPDK